MTGEPKKLCFMYCGERCDCGKREELETWINGGLAQCEAIRNPDPNSAMTVIRDDR
jgi:hypothetical protein